MIQETIIKWIVPFICGSAATLAGTLFLRTRSLRAGVRCLLRAEIISQYEKWTAAGSCPVYAKEALSKAYTAYHGLGGNDVATDMYEATMRLPVGDTQRRSEPSDEQ